MIIIGITGNTGAGKTTVSTIIKNNSNALVINADEISKSIMEPGNEYYDEVVKLFGNEILQKKPAKNKGRVHRPTLAKIIFKDDGKREALNKLTFRYVGQETKKIILDNKNKEMIVLDFPLLFEGGFNKICNYIIAVVADEHTKNARLRERDKISSEQVSKRLECQPSEEFYTEKANYVIKNSENNRYINLVKDTLSVIHKIKKDAEGK